MCGLLDNVPMSVVLNRLAVKQIHTCVFWRFDVDLIKCIALLTRMVHNNNIPLTRYCPSLQMPFCRW